MPLGRYPRRILGVQDFLCPLRYCEPDKNAPIASMRERPFGSGVGPLKVLRRSIRYHGGGTCRRFPISVIQQWL